VQSKGLRVLEHISPAEGLLHYLPTRSTDGTSIGIGGTTKNLILAGNEKLLASSFFCMRPRANVTKPTSE